MITNKTLILMVSTAVFLFGCTSKVGYFSEASTINVVPQVGYIPDRKKLPQGWSQDTREKFWFTSQGSRIVPYNWFIWLEQPNNTKLFRDAEHFEMLRYLPSPASKKNPAGLPIGFVAANDAKTNEAWVGMTCAACHTTQIDYKSEKLLVEGAPTLGNFVLFYERLVKSLNNTKIDNAKFNRFAVRVLGDRYNENTAAELRTALSEVAQGAANRLAVNALPADYPADFTSYARLDAFGNIQNAGTAFALHDLANRNAPTGPVSYPFLWGTHQSDVVQWNASAPNTPVIGPLSRNVGEVIGVFGDLSIDKAPWWKRLLGIKLSYSSNVDIEGLGRLEAMVKTLRSPQWPASYFPAIDSIKAGSGNVLFAAECAQCHQVIARADEGKKYKANQTAVDEIGTDPTTAWNADRRCAKTLELEGTKQLVVFGKKFEAESSAISIPVNGAVGIILKQPKIALEAGLRPLFEHSKTARNQSSTSMTADDESTLDAQVSTHGTSLEDYVGKNLETRAQITSSDDLKSLGPNTCGDPDAKLVYKGRPLNGIWATAPYLHNGSVPNLWELLRKGENRTDRFWVGSREFDPVNVGYQTSQGLNEFHVKNKDGNIMKGNSNLGHEYGTNWTDEEKWAVIEYMKTL